MMLLMFPLTVAFGATVNSCGCAATIGAVGVATAFIVPSGLAGGALLINPVGGGGAVTGAGAPGVVGTGGTTGGTVGAFRPGATEPLIAHSMLGRTRCLIPRCRWQ